MVKTIGNPLTWATHGVAAAGAHAAEATATIGSHEAAGVHPHFHTVHSSTTKAVCAASNKRLTSSRGAVAQELDVAHAIGLALAAGPERWTAMEGGCPIISDGECIGGIGIAGGDWQTDERIAQQAVESIGASWRSDPR